MVSEASFKVLGLKDAHMKLTIFSKLAPRAQDISLHFIHYIILPLYPKNMILVPLVLKPYEFKAATRTPLTHFHEYVQKEDLKN